jgi:hypothetical protein
MGKTKPHRKPQSKTVRAQASLADALSASKYLLQVDLNEATCEQEEAARAALKHHPSYSELILAARHWAQALADVCRRHARDCAQVHVNRDGKDPAALAMGTILLALSDHLRLSADGSLLFENWPAENALRDFVLEVSGAPIQLIDGEIVTRPTLPRWEPKSSFARKIAGLVPYSQEQSTAFLSVDETEKHVRGLEESFRRALLDGLGTSFSEAVLALPAARVNGRHKTLSGFDQLAGSLYCEALQNEKRVSDQTLATIANKLDEVFSPPLPYLEKRARTTVAEHNKKHPQAALKTWQALAANARFVSAVRRRLARAGEKYKKSSVRNSTDNFQFPPQPRMFTA